MSSYKLMSLRIKKQCRQIQEKPQDNIMVSVKTQREIHFCIYGLDGIFKDGFYHGVLQLPENYPFSAPKFKLLTGNGRFQVGKYLPSGGMVQFMDNKDNLDGNIIIFFVIVDRSDSKRMSLAQVSLDRNFEDEEFVELFEQELKVKGVKHPRIKRQDDGIKELNMIEMNICVDDRIVMQQNIESVMLPEAENYVRLINNNRNHCVIKMLYAALVLVIAVIIFV